MQAIKTERLRQGIKGKELAQRLGVSPARITVLEREEARGAVTLAALEKAAAALDCRLEYRLVPRVEKPRIRVDIG